MFRPFSRSVRGTPRFRIAAVLAAIAVLTAVALCPENATAGSSGKWGGAIDPDALQIFKGMTDYLGSLQRFGLHTENTYEDVLETGQKFQFHFSSSVVAERPDKLRVERTDGQATHTFVYDGERLSMVQPELELYATITAPDNLDDFLHFARDSLDLVPPVGDLVFEDAFELLMASVTSGVVVGKAIIGGVTCDHLAFRTPLVDWQVWIADGEQPLPHKYVLTTRDDPAQPLFMTLISEWTTEPKIEDGTFVLEKPADAMEIDFVLVGAGDTSAR